MALTFLMLSAHVLALSCTVTIAGEVPSRPPPPPQGLAHLLSAEDLSSVASTLRAFVLRVLLPSLQARVARLDANVTATRRGLRNRLTRFWKAPVAGTEDVLNKM